MCPRRPEDGAGPGHPAARISGALLLLCASLALSAYGPAGYTSSDDGPPLPADTLAPMAADHPPAVTARSALVMDVGTGAVLWAADDHAPRAPASLTKLMTALLLLETPGDVNRVVTVSPLAAAAPGSRMGLAAGARLRLSDLLAGLLLPSGNDAAVAIAESVDGSPDAFVAHMQARARALHLDATTFRTPSGLDAPGQVSTARDLAAIALLDLRFPLFNRLVGTRALVVHAPDGATYNLTNLNQLLGSYEGADGVKTGTTPEAGENLVASATRDGHRVLVVVLGSQDRYADARALLDYAWSQWRWVEPSLPSYAGLPAGQGQAGGPLSLDSGPALPVHAWQAPLLGYALARGDGAASQIGQIARIVTWDDPDATAGAPARAIVAAKP